MKHLAIILIVGATALFGLNFYQSGTASDTLFVHSVYFWLKDDVTEEQRAQFFEVLRDLERIKSVDALELGVPAGTPRDVVDNSYDVALLVYFKDRADHDLYQTDVIHKDAIEIFEDWIDEIKIYDAICTR